MMTLRRAASIALRGVLLLAALALAGGLGYRLYGLQRVSLAVEHFQRGTGSLILAEYAPTEVKPLENAATWLRRGVEALILFEDNPNTPGEKSAVGKCALEGLASIDAPARAHLAEAIARNGPAFELLERGAALPASRWFGNYREGTHSTLPELVGAIGAGRLLACRCSLAVERSDLDEALRHFETLGGLARSYENEPILVVQMIGAALERLQLSLGRDLLSRADVGPDRLDQLERAVSTIDLEAQIRRAFAFEAATVNDVLRGELPLRDVNGTEYHLGTFDRVAFWFVGPAERAAGLESWGTLAAATRKPWVEGKQLAEDAIDARMGWAMPNVLEYAGRAQATRTLRDGFLAAVALRRIALRDGEYPATLADAPRDRLTGRPFRYTRAGDGSALLERGGDPEEIEPILLMPGTDRFEWALPAPGPRR